MAFLHQALYVHEFGETSVLAERDGEIVGLPARVHRARAAPATSTPWRYAGRPAGSGWDGDCTAASWSSCRRARRERPEGDHRPENEASRCFHEALGFSVEVVEDYSPSDGERLVVQASTRARID